MTTFEALYRDNSLPYATVPIISTNVGVFPHQDQKTSSASESPIYSPMPGKMDISEYMDQLEENEPRAKVPKKKQKPKPQITQKNGLPYTDWSKVVIVEAPPKPKRPSLRSRTPEPSETASVVSTRRSTVTSEQTAVVATPGIWEQYKYPILIGGGFLLTFLGIQVMVSNRDPQPAPPQGYYRR